MSASNCVSSVIFLLLVLPSIAICGAKNSIPKKRMPKVTLGEGLVVKGSGLSKSEVQNVFRAHMGKFRGCYYELLDKYPPKEGYSAFKFDINLLGEIENLKFWASSFEGKTGSKAQQTLINTCLNNELSALKFPQPKGDESVAVGARLDFGFGNYFIGRGKNLNNLGRTPINYCKNKNSKNCFAKGGNGGIARGSVSPYYSNRSKAYLHVEEKSISISGGGLTRSEIHLIFKRNAARFRECYFGVLEISPNDEGSAEFAFDVGKVGDVKDLIVTMSTNFRKKSVNSIFKTCVKNAIYLLKYPVPRGGAKPKINLQMKFNTDNTN